MTHPLPHDEHVPIALLLSSEESREVIDVLVAETGAALIESSVRQVRYVPGHRAVVQYRATIELNGSRSTDTFVITTDQEVPGPTVELEVDGFPLRVWRYPADPFLPGLPAATDPTRVTRLFYELGSNQPRASLRARSYRPGKRAVIEAVAPSARLFIKVVRPEAAAGIHQRHRSLAVSVPVPDSHGWSAELGLVAIRAMTGKTLRRALETGTRRLPPPEAILSLPRSFPESDSGQVVGPVGNAARHAELLRVVLPEAAPELERIVAAFGAVSAGPLRPVHGDFHASQILIREEKVVGLIDVDTAGHGELADDYATLLGQLATLTLNSPRRKSISSYLDALVQVVDQTEHPVELRLRVAAAVLGFATGPFRVQEAAWPAETRRRVGLALEWVERAWSLETP